MRMLTFARRNTKEILRDPLNLAFGLGFPVVLLLLLSAIQASIPVPLFEIGHLTPGITVFGLSFMTLFSATIIARDRSSALLQRLYTTPLTAADFILGYTLPMLPISAAQCLICYALALALGLGFTVNILWAVLFILPVSLLYIGLGLLCGSVFTDKQVGGICGALLTNLSAWLSGIWFDLDLVGGAFKAVAYALPFVHAVELERAVLSGSWSGIGPHLAWVLGYGLLTIAAAIALFLRQMRKQ
ncbi:MAG: ABC transporter permease [Oscillospiraceae bacterium]|nr:ABC transporter permease [Oscillospiraceae bacterium]